MSLDLKTFFKLNRKKKKNKEKKKVEEAAAESMAKGSNKEKQNSASEDTRTPAQKAYDKIQEKRVNLLLSLFFIIPLTLAFFSLNCCKNNSNKNKNNLLQPQQQKKHFSDLKKYILERFLYDLELIMHDQNKKQ